MAALYVSEYRAVAALGLGGGGNQAQAPVEPANVDQPTVPISASSTQSQAFALGTNFIRVHCDAICSIQIGVNPTAVTSVKRMIAGQTEFFGVQPGHKIAVIQNV